MSTAQAGTDPFAAASPGAAAGSSETGRSASGGGRGAGDEARGGTQPAVDAPAPTRAGGGPRPMNLLCSLGRHAPRAAPRWNDGYYFATCRRCGQDIVRTAYEGWRVPRGYRVVWAATAPPDRPGVALAPEVQASPPAAPEAPAPVAPGEPAPVPAASVEPDAAPPPLDAEEEGQHDAVPSEAVPVARKRRILPIEAVLARLREEKAPDVETAPASTPPASSNRPYWDFMDEGPPPDPGRPAVPAGTGMLVGDRAPGRQPRAPKPPRAPRPPRKPWLRQSVARMARRLTPGEGNRPWVIAAAAFVIAASLIVLGVTLSPPSRPQPSETPIGETQPLFPAPSASPAPGDADAFVTASVLSCRDAPARQARRVRNLGRGDAVRILARDGEWVSIGHRGAQCWALARFVAAEKPLR